jgi:hypothetical protein
MPDGYRQGFWCTDTGALKVVDIGAAVGPTRWQDGFLLDANNALVTTTAGPGTMRQGFMRDSAGAPVIGSGAATPLRWQDGFLLDANGALVTVAPGGGQAYSGGYLRGSNGALVVA